MTRRTTHTTAIALLAALALFAAACGDTKSSAPTTTPGSTIAKDATLAAMVPADIAAKGVLKVGSDASYKPNEYFDTDNTTVIGMDVDLIKAVAATLGLTADVANSSFDAIIPGVTTSKKFDVGASSFTINAERLQQVNMIEYYSAGTLWATAKGTTIDIDKACGKKIAVQKATVQVDDITERSTTCTNSGAPAIQIDQYEKQTDATQAVVSGKDDAMLADSPVTAYAVKELGGKLEVAGEVYGAAPYGLVVAKDSGQLAQAIEGALKTLITNGEYGRILAKWSLESGAVTADQVAVNPPVS